MKVLIVGYGRMGTMIEGILKDRDHMVVARVDPSGNADAKELNANLLEQADGVIEFALKNGIRDRIRLYAESERPVVIGTTGWDDYVDEAKNHYTQGQSALLRGSNFSLGAHIFFRLSAAAATLVNKAEEYDVSLIEHHHRAKADYPSGTAITAAEAVLEALDRKTHIVKNLPEGPLTHEALQVAAVRVGSVPGIHEMRMDSAADFITIRHEARNRSGFALGAVRALEWLQGKSGWYEAGQFMDDLLNQEN